jgi:hypothetical protein
MNDKNITYDTRIVAFIDILGFKEIIKKSAIDSTKINLIYSLLKYLKDWETIENWDLRYVEIEEDAQKKGVDSFDIRGKTNCTAFSDSIFISVKVNNNINEMASTLIVNLAYIGSILLEQGILIRGAITYGDIIHENNGIAFGQGLIDSYLLESNYSKYPRIILSDKLINELNYPLESKSNRYPYHQYVERFSDGCAGFHQLIYYQVISPWTEMSVVNLKNSLDRVRNVIVGGLDYSFQSPQVFEKYNWLKDRYNNLIILRDYNIKDKTANKEKNIKIKLYDLNENIVGQNIHYSHTDNVYEMIRKDKLTKL